jgi:membrane protein implicated in regulation of membrane protease activity
MVGMRGTAEGRLAPTGHVRIQGEIWKAELKEKSQPVEKGKPILVQQIRGLTLIVDPDSKEDDS